MDSGIHLAFPILPDFLLFYYLFIYLLFFFFTWFINIFDLPLFFFFPLPRWRRLDADGHGLGTSHQRRLAIDQNGGLQAANCARRLCDEYSAR